MLILKAKFTGKGLKLTKMNKEDGCGVNSSGSGQNSNRLL